MEYTLEYILINLFNMKRSSPDNNDDDETPSTKLATSDFDAKAKKSVI